MHILSARRERIELDMVPGPAEPPPALRASRAFFELGRSRGNLPRRAARTTGPAGPAGSLPAVFRERRTGLLRMVYREVVARFRAGVGDGRRRAILGKLGLEVRRENAFIPEQVVAAPRSRRRQGADMLELANRLSDLEEVVFATPNFVSEYRRKALPAIPPAQWHLREVEALEAWKVTPGKSSVVIAILDDGVDLEHPALRSRIWKNADPRATDRLGRDFFLPDDHPDHYNPRPKKFRFPYDQMAGNDIHGTACAGVAAAAGRDAYGIAFRCRILAVKIFHADELAPDERVADAIRYAAVRAGILSCSWAGGRSPDVELALEDAGRLGRGGLGSAVFCAAGNEEGSPVGFPASDGAAIAVGASTDGGKLAWYSNVGPELDLVAPSSGGARDIFTTDVSYAGRGFNVGREERGGKDGLNTGDFGGTSSATPLAAGVGALVLSVNPRLDRESLRGVLEETADKIGTGYDEEGHSPRFGHGRVNAARAVRAAKA